MLVDLKESKYPNFEDSDAMPKDMAYQIIEEWCLVTDNKINQYLDAGAWGHAFLLDSGLVVKVTINIEEAAFSFDAIQKKPFGYVPTHSVNKVNDSIFIITMDFVERPDSFIKIARQLDYVVDNNHYRHDVDDINKIIPFIEDPDVYKLHIMLHNIVNHDPDFVMFDIHCENIGLCSKTGQVLVFDQPHDLVTLSEIRRYCEKIETISL